MKLGGVIYLLSIAEQPMKDTTRKNIELFHQLCGDKALASVVLGTTKWGMIDENVGQKREQQLAENFFNAGMMASASKVLRFDRTEGSARVFLDAILGQLKFGKNEEILNDSVLQIQNEIVELERRIPETAAGKELRYILEQGLEIQKEEGNFEQVALIQKQIDELYIPSLPQKLYMKFFVSRLENFQYFFANFAFGRGKMNLNDTFCLSTWRAYPRVCAVCQNVVVIKPSNTMDSSYVGSIDIFFTEKVSSRD